MQTNRGNQREYGFNTQPPEGGWELNETLDFNPPVSTHSRPKAAGRKRRKQKRYRTVSTHSRPKAAGC